MANYNKAFNFRNGVQVDDDNLVVNANGLVGIGTSVPTEVFDVRGTAKVVGLLTAIEVDSSYLNVLGIATIKTAKIGIVSITSGGIVTATSSTGVVTYFGDGGRLLNLPTSQWVDVNSGLGFTSIYAQGFVGIATNMPYYPFQVGVSPDTGNGVGIDSRGGIVAAGIITANSFSGSGIGITSINADNVTFGTLTNSRLPVINNDRLPADISITGIITAQSGFFGTLTGIAATANSLPSGSNISIRSINTGFSTSGISTITTRLRINGTIGFNTDSPTSDFHLLKSTGTSLQLTSTAAESLVLVGRSLSKTTNVGGLRFGNVDIQYPYSTQYSLDIINYDVGNVNTYINSGTTSGINTGNFNWIYGKNNSNPLMTLTYGGYLGIGITTPTLPLHVVGVSTFSTDMFVGNNLSIANNIYVGGGIVIPSGVYAAVFGNLTGNVYASSGISTFNSIRVTSIGGIGGTTNSGGIITPSIGIGTYVGNQANVVVINSTGVSTVSSIVIAASGDIGIGTTVPFNPGGKPYTAIDARTAYLSSAGVGIGTRVSKSYADFSNAGRGLDSNVARFMVPPIVTTTERNALVAYDSNLGSPTSAMLEGALVYNKTLQRLELYNGSGWVGIATTA
jgi:hypothetical protein